MPQQDDRDDLSALDFTADEADPSVEDSDALDFSVADSEAEDAAADAWDDYAPVKFEEAETDLAAIDSAIEPSDEEGADEEGGVQIFTVTNPPDTVSVSALMDGRTHRVELSPKAAAMSESELAEEIIVLAGLARQKGLAGQHTFLQEDETLTESMRELGLDGNGLVLEFAQNFMKVPTPQEAAAAQAELFATRYTENK